MAKTVGISDSLLLQYHNAEEFSAVLKTKFVTLKDGFWWSLRLLQAGLDF